MQEVRNEIKALQATLTGDLFTDMETQQKIYELKKSLVTDDVTIEDIDNEFECLSCGS